MSDKKEIIGVVGLGYVGGPLAMAFSKHYEVIGYDAAEKRITDLKNGYDVTGEFSAEDLAKATSFTVTHDPADLARCTFILVAVPTPLGSANEPDLTALKNSSALLGRVLKKGMMVVYESTVYPGVTEEVCLPILEKESGLKLGDFDLGYSPERVNPGDKEHTVSNVIKIVSGHDAASLDRAARVYGSILEAGVHRATNIKTAEAAKVIENVQRDLNISLMNELAKIFALMDIDTKEVIEAAGTKWNFHHYYPGLVGGHCIGVDPYYLTYRAMQLGYHPEVILAGRRINDSMGHFVGELTIRSLIQEDCLPKNAKVLVMGLTFKENVPDFRNSRAQEVVKYLQEYGVDLYVWEPLATPEDITRRYGLRTMTIDQADSLDAVILVNAHDAFKPVTLEKIREKMKTPILVDVKNFYSKEKAKELGFNYISL